MLVRDGNILLPLAGASCPAHELEPHFELLWPTTTNVLMDNPSIFDH